MELAVIIGRNVPEANMTIKSVAATHPSPKRVVTMTPLVVESLAPEGDLEADDDNATVSTWTDDDIVNMVMMAVLPLDDDDDEMEQVVYPKQNISLPTV